MNFVEYVETKYKDYPEETSISLIKAYCKYAASNDHLLFEEHIKENFNNAFGEDKWDDYVEAKKIAKVLSGEAKEVLRQIVKKPTFDGDVVSKAGKSELFKHKLILRICNNNEFGDNAANYLGWLVYEEIIKNECTMYE
jgi:hypothetical protein